MNEDVKKLRESLAALEKKITETKGEAPNPMMDNMVQMIQNMRSYIYGMEDRMYQMQNEHNQGHAPKLKTATHLQKYLKACGMEDDYEVQKPVLYARASKGTIEFTLDTKNK